VNRRLYRCRHDRKLAGVAAGVAEYFELDPTLVRVVWFLSIFFGGLGIFLYIAMALIVPAEPLTDAEVAALAAGVGAGGAVTAGHQLLRREGNGRVATFIGAVLILLGAIAFIDAVAPAWESWRYLWPAFLVGVGALLVAGALRRDRRESQATGSPELTES